MRGGLGKDVSSAADRAKSDRVSPDSEVEQDIIKRQPGQQTLEKKRRREEGESGYEQRRRRAQDEKSSSWTKSERSIDTENMRVFPR